jgi:hypothetical protein
LAGPVHVEATDIFASAGYEGVWGEEWIGFCGRGAENADGKGEECSVGEHRETMFGNMSVSGGKLVYGVVDCTRRRVWTLHVPDLEWWESGCEKELVVLVKMEQELVRVESEKRSSRPGLQFKVVYLLGRMAEFF